MCIGDDLRRAGRKPVFRVDLRIGQSGLAKVESVGAKIMVMALTGQALCKLKRVGE